MTNTSFRAIRRRLGMTQRQLARVIGCAPTSVSHWKRARGKPIGPTVARLMRLLDDKRRQTTERRAR